MMLRKDPSSILDYKIDWASALGADTISTSAWTVTGGVVVDSDSNDTTTATAVLSGGERGATCEATNTITTAGSKTHQQTAIIRVMDL